MRLETLEDIVGLVPSLLSVQMQKRAPHSSYRNCTLLRSCLRSGSTSLVHTSRTTLIAAGISPEQGGSSSVGGAEAAVDLTLA